MRVVLDLLDQLTNTIVLSLFHNRMWQAIQVFGSQCQPRLTLIARDLARDLCHGKQRVSPFYHDLFHVPH